MASTVPRPGPANLGPNAALDEWLEEAKQCHYLPERAMKELCEKVKEILMEGAHGAAAPSPMPPQLIASLQSPTSSPSAPP